MQQSPPDGALRPCAAAMAAAIAAGGAVDDALRSAQRWLPEADTWFLSAAADAGRMPSVLRSLAERHRAEVTARRRLWLGSAYPLGVLHLGLLLLPILKGINWQRGFVWDGAAYARALASTLLPLWAGAFALGWLVRRRHPLVEALGRRLPLVGAYLRAKALADLAFALGNFVEAGVPIGRAWAVAGLVVRSPELARACRTIETAVEHGTAPGTLLPGLRCFPASFAARYRSGEHSGGLDESLRVLARDHQERATRALTLVTIVYPMLTFFLVAGAVAYHVIGFFRGYYDMLGQMAN